MAADYKGNKQQQGLKPLAQGSQQGVVSEPMSDNSSGLKSLEMAVLFSIGTYLGTGHIICCGKCVSQSTGAPCFVHRCQVAGWEGVHSGVMNMDTPGNLLRSLREHSFWSLFHSRLGHRAQTEQDISFAYLCVLRLRSQLGRDSDRCEDGSMHRKKGKCRCWYRAVGTSCLLSWFLSGILDVCYGASCVVNCGGVFTRKL